MKPRDAIRSALGSYVAPRLSRLGFSFAASSLSFVRKRERFQQRIESELNRLNVADISATFSSRFTVRSAFYSQWHKEHFGDKPANDYLVSEGHWNLRGWQHAYPEAAHPERAEFEMLKLLEDILDHGIPFLEKFSDWEAAGHRLAKQHFNRPKTCDFFIIANNKEEAYRSLCVAVDDWKSRPQSFYAGEKEDVELRFQKFFGESVALD